MREALTRWRDAADDLKLENAGLIRELLAAADTNVLEPMEQGKEGSPPNEPNLRAWVMQTGKPGPSLFKSDPSTTVNGKPQHPRPPRPAPSGAAAPRVAPRRCHRAAA